MLGLITIFDNYEKLTYYGTNKNIIGSIDLILGKIENSSYNNTSKEFTLINHDLINVWNFLYLAKINGIEIEYFKFNNKKIEFESVLKYDYLSEKYLNNIKTLKIKIYGNG